MDRFQSLPPHWELGFGEYGRLVGREGVTLREKAVSRTLAGGILGDFYFLP